MSNERKFLVGIKTSHVVIQEDPILPSDAIHRQYLNDLLTAYGLPIAGGLTGESLVKTSGADYDYTWQPISASAQPSGKGYYDGGSFIGNIDGFMDGGAFI